MLIFFPPAWLRQYSPRPDPILQGYLQLTTGLFAFVFGLWRSSASRGNAGSYFADPGLRSLLPSLTLTASSVLFFQLIHESQTWVLLAPVAWWISRLLLALLFVVALLVEHFLPRSRHPRLEIAGALFTVLALTYLIAASLRKLPPDVSGHPYGFIPTRFICCQLFS